MILRYTAFDAKGYVIASGQKFMGQSMDWAPLEEKELWFQYMGGLPENTAYCLISSQGNSKLVTEIPESATVKIDKDLHNRRMENVEQYLEEECRRRGVERSRIGGNQ